MAKVELKQPIVEEIKNNFADAQAAVLVDYRGLTVEQDTRLRKQLRENGVIYKVYKNTMVNLAVQGTEFEELTKDLEGPTAVAFSKTDATAPARILCKFAKEAPALEVKSGIIDGTYYDKAGVETLSNIPSREELLSKLLGSIQSPIANFARVIKQIAESKEAEA
ncbi:MAG: 50S ribosomal protein L10 [Lachnospiraceae bacterium]|nr:50S ribosomal protein L10 [Lachnospiraceae bacterium]